MQTPKALPDPTQLYSKSITGDPKATGNPKRKRREPQQPLRFFSWILYAANKPPLPLPSPNPYLFLCAPNRTFSLALRSFMHGSFIAPGGGAGLRPGEVRGGASAAPAAAGTGGDHGLAEPTGGHHAALGELVTAQVGCGEVETRHASSSCRSQSGAEWERGASALVEPAASPPWWGGGSQGWVGGWP